VSDIKEKRRDFVKQHILDLAKPFIKEDNTFDKDGFFTENSYYADKMQYYFGGRRNFYNNLGVVVKRKESHKENIKKAKELRANVNSIRNQLALERLLQLRKAGMTFEEMGTRYDVSKQLINYLYNTLNTVLDDELF
jgi:hypothetical protein